MGYLISCMMWFTCSEVRVEGLETLDYLDNLLHRERFTEQADALTFDGEVDQIYLRTPTDIAIIDHEKKRTFVFRKDGMPDAVMWNPLDKTTKGLSDFGDDDYKPRGFALFPLLQLFKESISII